MERETGLEPATSSLGSWHSTTELLPLAFIFNDFHYHVSSRTLSEHLLYYQQLLLQLVHNHQPTLDRRLRVHV
jgi:hypothetical protein